MSFRRILSVIVSEAATGLALGASCGLITAAASYLINMDSPDILKLALAVLIGMVISVPPRRAWERCSPWCSTS